MIRELLSWYDVNKRELPFRKDKDPYRIWISEIMAQQTRIEAMLPYYDRFIEKYPDVKSLANADDEELHKMWQGLGYYSRCRNLKKSAIECMERYDGKLPGSKEELVKLPGIGPYTAGAIASIAYDENVSAIDGNVIRVFSRLYDIHEDVTLSSTKKKIEKLVNESLSGSEYISDYNQALMELGALICIPQNPRCDKCPLQNECEAKDPSSLPVTPPKKGRPCLEKQIFIWVCDEKIHLKKREEKGLLHGLYGFDETKPENIIKEIRLNPYSHIFSHVTWKMDAKVVYVDSCVDTCFYTLDQIVEKYAIPSAFKPFLDEIIDRKLVKYKP